MIKKMIPARIRGSINVLLGRAKAVPKKSSSSSVQAGKYICPACGTRVSSFNRLPDLYQQKQDEVGYIHPIFQMETINRLAYSCPNCKASDRERLYALYFKNIYKQPHAKFKLLDIAPAKPLQKFIKSHFPEMEYRSADLMMEDVDDKVDITNMNIYDDNSFDFFICSHVLEHIEDDKKAMKELFRILKPGGKGIAMVPILLSLTEDYENPEVKTEDERWKHFGQNDHVRMYSKPGFISKLTNAGFNVTQFNIDSFGVEVFTECGIHPRSVLYIVEK
jgi:SAM-dependent methyltransferase